MRGNTMKKAYLVILLLIGLVSIFAIQIGMKGERYATEGLEYFHRGEYNKAIERFKEADLAANGDVPYYFYWLGRLHIAVQDTTNAMVWLDRYVKSEDQEFRQQVDTFIEIIGNQDKAFEKISLRAMPAYINSRNSDYGALADPSGKYLYFTSWRPGKADKENIWRAEIFKSGYGKPQLVTDLSTDSNEAMGSFAADSVGAYIFGNYEKGKLDGDIYYTEWDGSRWTKPSPQPWFNSPDVDTHPSVYNDSLMFFSSSRPGGYGEIDIWVSQKVDGVWTEPVNAGPNINTPGIEQTPHLVHFTKDIVHEGRNVEYKETALYFSSNTHPGFGGFDLFKAVHKGPTWQDWHLAQNLGLPINSIQDDRYFSTRPGSNEVYISSDRQAPGFEKVLLAFVDYTVPGYFVTQDTTGTRVYEVNIPPYVPPADSLGEPIIEEPVVEEPPRMITFTGKVTDEKGEPVATDITFTGLVDDETRKDVVTTNEDGTFEITVPYADPWTVVINPEGFMLYQQDIPAPPEGQDAVNIDFAIERLVVKKVFVFNNIQFDFDKATLRKESFPILDDIVITMLNNPEIKIEISGHTCNIGTAKYNQGLSQRRAKAVVDYLIKKGVEKERLSYKGFGLSKPLNKNKTKAQRALNRRVEVKVVEE